MSSGPSVTQWAATRYPVPAAQNQRIFKHRSLGELENLAARSFATRIGEKRNRSVQGITGSGGREARATLATADGWGSWRRNAVRASARNFLCTAPTGRWAEEETPSRPRRCWSGFGSGRRRKGRRETTYAGRCASVRMARGPKPNLTHMDRAVKPKIFSHEFLFSDELRAPSHILHFISFPTLYLSFLSFTLQKQSSRIYK